MDTNRRNKRAYFSENKIPSAQLENKLNHELAVIKWEQISAGLNLWTNEIGENIHKEV